MKFFSTKYKLLLIGLSLIFLSVDSLVASAETQRTSNTTYKSKVVNKNIRSQIKYKSAKTKNKPHLTSKKQSSKEVSDNYDGSTKPVLSSSKALIVNHKTGRIKYSKNSNVVTSIASITKLMTAMVVLDAKQPFDEVIRISKQDVDTIKNTWSRLKVGTTLTRAKMFQLALMSSENRATFSLASNYPGGRRAFVKAMNKKAALLGMANTHFAEPTGLMYQNTSTAEDLYKLVAAAYHYEMIRKATTTPFFKVHFNGNKAPTKFKNTNVLVRKGEWDIGLSKTGFIDEAGRCLVMQTTIDQEPIITIFLDAEGSKQRVSDAKHIRKWVEYNHREKIQVARQRKWWPKLEMSSNILEN